MFRGCFPCEVRYRFICDVDGKGEEADPYNPEAHFFISFPPLNVRVDRHSPQQCGTRRNFDETINSETNKGDAPETTPAAIATKPSRKFHTIVKYSSRFPRWAIAWRAIVNSFILQAYQAIPTSSTVA